MTAILLSLAAALSWGTSDFVGGRASRGRHVVGVLAITRPAGLLVVGIVALAATTPGLGDRWPTAMLAAPVLLGGMLCLYSSLARGPMSIVAPIFATGAAVPVLAGVASGDVPGVVTFAGLVVTLAGTVLAARAPSEGTGRAGATTIALAAGAAVLLGLGLTLIDHAAQRDAVEAILVERVGEAVLILALAAWWFRTVRPRPRGIGLLPVAGFLDVSANLLFALAATTGLLPVVAVLSSLYPVITVLLARAVLDERISRLQAAGVALTLLGVGVVAGTG